MVRAQHPHLVGQQLPVQAQGLRAVPGLAGPGAMLARVNSISGWSGPNPLPGRAVAPGKNAQGLGAVPAVACTRRDPRSGLQGLAMSGTLKAVA